MTYLLEFLHAYSMHFGFWMTFIFAMSFYKNGMPSRHEIGDKLITAAILSSILSIFSGHSQAHYIAHFIGG